MRPRAYNRRCFNKREARQVAWVFLTLTYGLLKGARDIVKKKAMGKSSVM